MQIRRDGLENRRQIPASHGWTGEFQTCRGLKLPLDGYKTPEDSKIEGKVGGRRGWLQREKYSGNIHRGDSATKPWKSRDGKDSKGKIMIGDENKARLGHLLR